MIRRVVSLALALAITAAALWYLLTPEIIGALTRVAAKASWPGLALATAMGALVQWLRAWRFSIMTGGDLAFPGRRLVGIAFRLNFFNFVLPFRLGELSYPMMMSRAYGQPVLRAAGVLVLVRLFDLCTVGAILAASSAALDLGGHDGLTLGLWALAAALAAGPFGLVLAAGWALPLARLLPVKARLAEALALALGHLGRRRAQFAAILLSFAIWLVFAALAFIAARSVTEAIGPAVALLGASASNLAFALPVNGIGGLGASQAAWVFVVHRAGIAFEDAVISALALYAVTLTGALVFGGAAMLAGPVTPTPPERETP